MKFEHPICLVNGSVGRIPFSGRRPEIVCPKKEAPKWWVQNFLVQKIWLFALLKFHANFHRLSISHMPDPGSCRRNPWSKRMGNLKGEREVGIQLSNCLAAGWTTSGRAKWGAASAPSLLLAWLAETKVRRKRRIYACLIERIYSSLIKMVLEQLRLALWIQPESFSSYGFQVTVGDTC